MATSPVACRCPAAVSAVSPVPWPAPPLTPAQRYHLEVHGYVVVENMFSADECEAMMSELRRVCDLAVDVDAVTHPDQVHLAINGPNHKCFENILAASPVLAAYATHPRMVAMAEELLGGEALHTADTCGTWYHDLYAHGIRMRASPKTGPVMRASAEPQLRACTAAALERAGVELADIDFFVFRSNKMREV